jgi:hypothetical protein
MMVRACRSLATLAAAALLATPAAAQLFEGVTIPPADSDIDSHSRGGAQHALVSQDIDPVRLTIDYSRPHVHSPTGVDRRGKIWGKGNLVEYGMATLPWGSCGSQCPWRGGANENTVFTTTHDVTIQGQRLPAGSYGVYFVPEADEWTIIFSKNHTSWGSFYYDAKEDALRVTAKPQPSEYHEDLTYEFRDQKPDSVTAVLRWEDLQLPFAIKVENIDELYVETMRQELRSKGGFNWRGWTTAARFCLTRRIHLDLLRPAEPYDPLHPGDGARCQRQGGRGEGHARQGDPQPGRWPGRDPSHRPSAARDAPPRRRDGGLHGQLPAPPERLAGALRIGPRSRGPGSQGPGDRGGQACAAAGP